VTASGTVRHSEQPQVDLPLDRLIPQTASASLCARPRKEAICWRTVMLFACSHISA
jgi:hypothetical protein